MSIEALRIFKLCIHHLVYQKIKLQTLLARGEAPQLGIRHIGDHRPKNKSNLLKPAKGERLRRSAQELEGTSPARRGTFVPKIDAIGATVRAPSPAPLIRIKCAHSETSGDIRTKFTSVQDWDSADLPSKSQPDRTYGSRATNGARSRQATRAPAFAVNLRENISRPPDVAETSGLRRWNRNETLYIRRGNVRTPRVRHSVPIPQRAHRGRAVWTPFMCPHQVRAH